MLFLDVETYSDEPIKNGHHRYAEMAELLMVAWAVDNGSVSIWDTFRQKDIPEELEDLLFSDIPICSHNAAFEQAIFKHCLQGLDIDPKRWRCTMAQAYAHGLPGALDNLGIVLGLPQDKKKSKEGYDLIRLFCIPPAANSKRGRATHETHPVEWDKFTEYCVQDVVAHREVYKRLPNWNYKGGELDLWHLDQEINNRGMFIDTELAHGAMRAVDKAKASLKARTQDLTFGDVDSATRRDALLAHILAAYGVELPDMQSATLERRIDDPDLPPALRELLAIRLQATTSSTAKYNKVLKMVSSDERLRGTMQFNGAARTGRTAGRGFQPANLARPTLPYAEIENGINAMKTDCADLIYDNVMEIASNAVRGLIVAPPGKKLLIADLANIEGRYGAWLANEAWKLKAFEDYDTVLGKDENGKDIRKGHDLYKLAYAKSFNLKPEDVTKKQRDTVGKTMELALLFGGGCGAFVTFALNFGVDLDSLVTDAWDAIPLDIREEATSFWTYCLKETQKNPKVDMTLGLKGEVFITCDSLKRMWRRAHPNVVNLWKEIQENAVLAITTKDKTFECRKLKFRRDGNWLRILMPSGRSLCYPHPRVEDKKGKPQISFNGINQYSRQWGKIETYGPKLFENTVQGGARDIFMAGLINANAEGYDTVLHVYDEQIDEVPDTEEYTVDRLCELMTTNIHWAAGLPLAASGFSSYRYRKGD